VREHVGAAGQPGSRQQRAGQPPGLAAGHRAVQPADLHAARRHHIEVLAGVARLEIGDAARIAGQRLQGGADGRQRRLVPGEKVPGAVRIRAVGTAGPGQREEVAGLRAGRPRRGDPLVPVHHEVNRKLLPLSVSPAQRVRAGHRLPASRE
jgi:hypothetical protein